MRLSHRVLAAAASLLLVSFVATAHALVADSAAGLCDANADPCVVNGPVEVSGTLDVGLRTLRVEGAGLLDVPAGSASIACGRLELATNGAAVRVRGGGAIALHARRACTLAADVPCLTDVDCAVVAAGSCSLGDGTATLAGAVDADGEAPGRIVVRAAAEVSILAPLTARATRAEADGGSVEVESTQDSLTIAAPVDVSGGGLAGGGDVDVMAAADVLVLAPVRADGGELDGGQIWLGAARDAIVRDDLQANAAAGAGFGGSLTVSAGRDARFEGGSSTNRVTIAVDGHQSIENTGGDGGTVDVEAGRDVLAARYVAFAASGAAPDGFADTLSFAADGRLVFEATLVAKGRGMDGAGATVDLLAEQGLKLSASSSIDLTGAAVGGDLTLESGAALEAAGDVDVSSAAGGIAGTIIAEAAGGAAVSGRWSTAGVRASAASEFHLEACRANVYGILENAAAGGRTTIVAHESAYLAAGSSVTASGAGAANVLQSRPDVPPRIDGDVRPEATVILDEALAPCSACSGAACDVPGWCADACRDTGCSVTALFEPSLALRTRSDGAAAMWKGAMPAPALPLEQADVRVVVAGATGALVDETLPAGSLVRAGSGWRMRSTDELARVRKAVFRRGRTEGALRARIQLHLDLVEVASFDRVSLALVVADPVTAVPDVPCAESAEISCEQVRSGTICEGSR